MSIIGVSYAHDEQYCMAISTLSFLSIAFISIMLLSLAKCLLFLVGAPIELLEHIDACCKISPGSCSCPPEDPVDLSYTPEIALVRQQAAALVDARKTIVEAAVDMTHTAIESLEAKGRPIDYQTKNGIASNQTCSP